MTNPTITISYWNIDTELKCRCGCNRFNYDTDFLIRLTGLRLILDKSLTVTSGGRCIKHNSDEGGVKTSLHQCETKKATAADVTNDNCKDIYQKACASGLFNEVEWHKTDSKNFVHVGWDPNQKGNSFKII